MTTEKQRRDSAKEILKSFTFTPLTDSSIINVIDAWRCRNPTSGSYAFDIIITTYGISIVGDISSITFRVGASYGMKFLAGQDIKYYIHSKLDSVFYEKSDFDEKTFMEGVAHRLGRAIYDDLDGDAPAWMDTDECTVKKLESWLMSKPKKLEGMTTNYLDVYTEADCVSSIREAKNFLIKSDLFNYPESWPSYKMTSVAVLQELYLINEAARRILAQDPKRYLVESEK